MKSHRILFGLSALALTICGVGVSRVIWDRPHTLYPTPETESAFLKNYTPKRVIEQFALDLTSSYGQHHGGEAGRMSVTQWLGLNGISQCGQKSGCLS